METRALALLRKVERVRNPGALYSKPGRKKRAGAGGNQGKDGKETRAARGAARSRRGAASADDDNDRELHEVPFCSWLVLKFSRYTDTSIGIDSLHDQAVRGRTLSVAGQRARHNLASIAQIVAA